MHFVMDTVSDNTYFENVLVGLTGALRKSVGIKNTSLKKLAPAPYSDIALWEHKQGVLLPEDLRAFYLSSNGLDFEYCYTSAGDDRADDMVVGKIEINPLEELLPVVGYEASSDPGVKFNGERYILRLSLESKVFSLALLPECGQVHQVVLVYLYPKYVPTIWLLVSPSLFYYLADDIATYLRMAVTHLGIPNWQFAYTPKGIPQWTENIFRMLAPHLLPLNNKTLEKLRRERRHRKDEDHPEVPVNKFDPNLFKVLPRPIISNVPRNQTPTPEPEKPKVIKKKLYPQQQTNTRPRIKSQKYQRKPLYYVKKR